MCLQSEQVASIATNHHFFTLKGSSTFGSFLRLTIITATCPPFTRKGMATITNRPLRAVKKWVFVYTSKGVLTNTKAKLRVTIHPCMCTETPMHVYRYTHARVTIHPCTCNDTPMHVYRDTHACVQIHPCMCTDTPMHV